MLWKILKKKAIKRSHYFLSFSFSWLSVSKRTFWFCLLESRFFQCPELVILAKYLLNDLSMDVRNSQIQFRATVTFMKQYTANCTHQDLNLPEILNLLLSFCLIPFTKNLLFNIPRNFFIGLSNLLIYSFVKFNGICKSVIASLRSQMSFALVASFLIPLNIQAQHNYARQRG